MGVLSAAMVAALVTGGTVASVGAAAAADDLPVNIVCPQVNTCEQIAAGIDQAHGVAVDGDGNSYVSTGYGVLWRVSSGGVKTQITTGLGNALGVAVDGDGNSYVGNTAGELWRVSSGGVKTQITTGLGSAFGVAMDGDGNSYVGDSSGVLWGVSSGGVKTQITTGLGAATGVALDGDGNFYVITLYGELWGVSPGGVKTQITTGLGNAYGVAVDGDGNAYVSNSAGVLWRVSPGGVKETVATNIGSGTYRAYGMALDGGGNAFVASFDGGSLWSLPGVGVPVNQPPAAPLVTVPKDGSTTGKFPKFAGKAVQENGAVDAEKVKVLDDNGIVLATVPVRQTDGYFSWKRDDAWPAGEHMLQFVAVQGERESQPTTVTFQVAPGPEAPTVSIPGDDAQVGPKPKFVGSAPGATQVLVQNLDNTTIAQLPVRGDGYFSWTQPTAWTAGPHTIQFVAKNSLGLSEPTLKKFIVHIPAPTITLPGNGSVTGSLPKFSGTAPANSTVVLYENNQKLGTANVNSSGNWTWRWADPDGVWKNWTNGLHTVDAYTTIAGSQSLDHTSVTFTVQ
ncbi:hypothetical protein [Streptomyces sp. MS2.AVA.5]|uniref:Uncharacterized protein n=3 Tax=Streptomyces achmelvichensis TaxID=3134111 RepID=A0ACC6PM79_9ACTN